jgi:hypothetical protein
MLIDDRNFDWSVIIASGKASLADVWTWDLAMLILFIRFPGSREYMKKTDPGGCSVFCGNPGDPLM